AALSAGPSPSTRLRMTALIDAAITFLALATSKSLNILITGGAGFIGSNLTLALQEKFPDTRLTVIDQFRQTHDNVESFRRLLNFARLNKSRIVYASSASTYGSVTGASSEGTEAA